MHESHVVLASYERTHCENDQPPLGACVVPADIDDVACPAAATPTTAASARPVGHRVFGARARRRRGVARPTPRRRIAGPHPPTLPKAPLCSSTGCGLRRSDRRPTGASAEDRRSGAPAARRRVGASPSAAAELAPSSGRPCTRRARGGPSSWVARRLVAPTLAPTGSTSPRRAPIPRRFAAGTDVGEPPALHRLGHPDQGPGPARRGPRHDERRRRPAVALRPHRALSRIPCTWPPFGA